MKRSIALMAVLALASPVAALQSTSRNAPPSSSPNEQSTFIMEVDGWALMMDHSMGDACYIAKGTTDGTAIRLTFDEARESLYLVAASRFWKSIDNDKKYRLSVRFDSDQPWIVDGTGSRLQNGIPFIGFEISDLEFLSDVKRSHSMTISYSGKEISKLSLAGSSNALAHLADCQSIADERRDPFAGKPLPPAPVYIPPPVPKVKDPFAT